MFQVGIWQISDLNCFSGAAAGVIDIGGKDVVVARPKLQKQSEVRYGVFHDSHHIFRILYYIFQLFLEAMDKQLGSNPHYMSRGVSQSILLLQY